MRSTCPASSLEADNLSESPGKPLRSLHAVAATCVHCGKGAEAGALGEATTTDGRRVYVHDRCYKVLLDRTRKQAQQAAAPTPPLVTPRPERVQSVLEPSPKSNGHASNGHAPGWDTSDVDVLDVDPAPTSKSRAQNKAAKADVPIAVRFLRRILPERGVYQFWVNPRADSKEKDCFNRFAMTIEELVKEINRRDSNGCWGVYHACAAFKNGNSRKQDNALGARSLWLDIDAGEGKKYVDRDAAMSALREFCFEASLPEPLIVASGPHGLHVYWTLSETLDLATWKRYAEGLKALCRKYEFHVGPERTADIASVLRTPGTHHRKGMPTVVKLLNPDLLDAEPYDVDIFAHLLDQTTARGNAPPRSNRNGRAREDASDHPASDGNRVADQCAQVCALRDTKGKLDEPLWYAAIEVLAHCKGGEKTGDQLAHEWSSGDHRYSAKETQERPDRARKFGPTTCERFHDLNPTNCESCKHWKSKIGSPATLGAPQRVTVRKKDLLDWEMVRVGKNEYVIKPRSCHNTRIALAKLGIKFSHDIFHNLKIVEGDAAENISGQLSDAACRALRELILDKFEFDPGKENVQEAAERTCEAHRFDPVVGYLDALHMADHLSWGRRQRT